MSFTAEIKVGDLIADNEHPTDDWGLIVYKDPHGDINKYKVLCNSGTFMYFPAEYVENDCQVINEGR